MRPCFLERGHRSRRECAALAPDPINLGIAEEQIGDGLLRRRGVVGRVGLRENVDAQIALNTGSAPLRRSSLTETPAGPFRTNVAFAVELLHQPFRRELAPLGLIGVNLRGQVLGVDKAVEIGDRNSLRAGVGDDAIERGGRTGVDDDRIEFASIIDWICWICVLAFP